jgi:hypothetical protein
LKGICDGQQRNYYGTIAGGVEACGRVETGIKGPTATTTTNDCAAAATPAVATTTTTAFKVASASTAKPATSKAVSTS